MGETTALVEKGIELIVKGDKFFMPITSQESIVTIEFDGPIWKFKPWLSGNYFYFDRYNEARSKNNEGHKIEFKAERKLERLVETNIDDCEWLHHKAEEITKGCQTKREIIDRLVEYLSEENEYYLVKKREVKLFARHLEENYWSDIKKAIESCFHGLRTRLLVNLKEEMMRKSKHPDKFDYKLFNERKDKIRAEFSVRLPEILLCYEPIFAEEFTGDARHFLEHVCNSWKLFKDNMWDYDLRPKRTIENGGRCEHKSIAFNALCQELDLTAVMIRGMQYDWRETSSHTMNAVEIDNGWEIDDPTQNKTQIKESRYLTRCTIRKKDDQIIKKAYFREK